MIPQTLVTAKSATLPVTLEEAKDHLRVTGEELEEYIDSLLEAATDYCETVTGRVLRVSHTVVQSYNGWPCGPIGFDRQPVTAIGSVKYYDANNVEQTVASTNYRLHKSTEAGSYLAFIADYSRPTYYDRDDAVFITYTAGYATIADVPMRAKHAIKMLIGHWFEHGEAVNIGNITTEVPMATEALLGSLSWGCYR